MTIMTTYSTLCILVLSLLSISPGEGLDRSSRSDDVQPLEVTVEHLTQTVQSLQAKVEALNSEMTQLKAQNQRKVAFSAFIPESGPIPASKGSLVPFSSIITNVGNAYNRVTHAFTSPFEGDFFFSVSVDVSGDYGPLSLRKNGVVMVYADKDDTTSTHVSASAVLSLKAGDVVTVNQDASVGHLDAGRDCSFTGFLVN